MRLFLYALWRTCHRLAVTNLRWVSPASGEGPTGRTRPVHGGVFSFQCGSASLFLPSLRSASFLPSTEFTTENEKWSHQASWYASPLLLLLLPPSYDSCDALHLAPTVIAISPFSLSVMELPNREGIFHFAVQ